MPLRQKTPITKPAGARALRASAVQAAKRARWELLAILPLLAGVILVNEHRREWFATGAQSWVRWGSAAAILVLGVLASRALGRFILPKLFKRMDMATAGVLGFTIRFALFVVTLLFAFSVLGLNSGTLAVGGAVFAVVFGLAAQQTLGNVFAGLVIIGAQPFRVGDRVRMQAGGLAGQLEGTVTAQGLLYTTFAQGEDEIMVPNTTVLAAAVVPLREPSGVDLRARLRPDIKPTEVQAAVDEGVRTEVRGEIQVTLEEVDADEVVVRISATPERADEGATLADEVLASIGTLAAEGHTAERQLARVPAPIG